MIISDEQVRRAVEYLQTTECSAAGGDREYDKPVPDDLLDRVLTVVSTTPELRDDRIAHARMLISGQPLSGAEVAEKIIGREISDHLR